MFLLYLIIKVIARSPYEVIFGCKPRVGLASIGISVNEICNLSKEEDIVKIMQQPENNEDNEIREDTLITEQENGQVEKSLSLLILYITLLF